MLVLLVDNDGSSSQALFEARLRSHLMTSGVSSSTSVKSASVKPKKTGTAAPDDMRAKARAEGLSLDFFRVKALEKKDLKKASLVVTFDDKADAAARKVASCVARFADLDVDVATWLTVEGS